MNSVCEHLHACVCSVFVLGRRAHVQISRMFKIWSGWPIEKHNFKWRPNRLRFVPFRVRQPALVPRCPRLVSLRHRRHAGKRFPGEWYAEAVPELSVEGGPGAGPDLGGPHMHQVNPKAGPRGPGPGRASGTGTRGPALGGPS